jgi:XRE family transcriptional regulator, regulator of sulfur utilization
MAKQFKELADRLKADWSADTQAVHEAAATVFDAERAARAELGAQIAELRRSQHLTQPALSVATGIQQSEISRIERGLGNPTVATLAKLAAVLGHRLVLQPGH